jgi:hypothetical protein
VERAADLKPKTGSKRLIEVSSIFVVVFSSFHCKHALTISYSVSIEPDSRELFRSLLLLKVLSHVDASIFVAQLAV